MIKIKCTRTWVMDSGKAAFIEGNEYEYTYDPDPDFQYKYRFINEKVRTHYIDQDSFDKHFVIQLDYLVRRALLTTLCDDLNIMHAVTDIVTGKYKEMFTKKEVQTAFWKLTNEIVR